jgi:hypothetical protein
MPAGPQKLKSCLRGRRREGVLPKPLGLARTPVLPFERFGNTRVKRRIISKALASEPPYVSCYLSNR